MIPTQKRYIISSIIALIMANILSLTGSIISLYVIKHTHKVYISGIIYVILTMLFYMFFMRKYHRRKRLLKQSLSLQLKQILQQEVAYYRALPEKDKIRFEKLAHIFLYEKRITGIKTEVDDTEKALVAASAIIPILYIPDWEYNQLEEILIYPETFDDSFDISSGHPVLGMVVSNTSSVILSKPALIDGFKHATDGFNVGIHEFIHKIDEEDGVIDGMPAYLINSEDATEWRCIMDVEMDAIEERKSDINSYALEGPMEFFSVVSEYFFEKPVKMSERHPELYCILKKIFKQDPKAILLQTIGDFIPKRSRRIKGRSKCPCGSGKRFKSCCGKK